MLLLEFVLVPKVDGILSPVVLQLTPELALAGVPDWYFIPGLVWYIHESHIFVPPATFTGLIKLMVCQQVVVAICVEAVSANLVEGKLFVPLEYTPSIIFFPLAPAT